MLPADVSVSINGRRLSCVLDPLLMLSSHGLTLVRRLSNVFDLWVVREWWHILDNSEFYRQRTEALWPRATDGDDSIAGAGAEEVAEVLSAWERVRARNDLAGLKLYWVGDGLSESLLAEGTDTDVVARYEQLAASLEQRQAAPETGVAPALRDAVALTAALGNAFILASMSPGVSTPRMTTMLLDWGLMCARAPDGDPLARTERDYMYQVLMHAGVLPLIWSGLGLSIVRLVAPSATTMIVSPQQELSGDTESLEFVFTKVSEVADLWRGAHAFWNPLAAAASHDAFVQLEDRRHGNRNRL